MRLISVYEEPAAAAVLYELMAQRPRESWISHRALPTMEEHLAFIAEHPFHHWYVIRVGGQFVGAIEANERNELGVAILQQYQGRGYGAEALRTFLDTHDPQPSLSARVNGRWLANIAVDNHGSKLFFRKMGFKPLQETYAL